MSEQRLWTKGWRADRTRNVAWNDALPCGERFTSTTGNLRGRSTDEEWWQNGRLPRECLAVFIENQSGADYVVWSYQTPIAWKMHDGAWYMPDVRYSATTTQHQGLVRLALWRIVSGLIECALMANGPMNDDYKERE